MEIVQIDNLPVSKASVEATREDIARRVLDGEISAVKVQSAIKFYEKVFNGDDKKNNGLNDIIKPFVVDEIEKDPHRKEWFGFEVSVGEAGARYHFDNCNYPKLTELYDQKKELEAKIKEVETMLKGIPKGGHLIITDEDTGEQTKVFAPAKTSTTSAKFLLKK
jgi:hypothetical protein